jgi:hypothetical protein
MEPSTLVDLVLDELSYSLQPSLSIRRVLLKKKIEFNEQLISSIEDILISKSLVEKRGVDSQGYARYSLTGTGHDFIRTFGSYSKFLEGIEDENKKVQRARKKQPYKAYTGVDGQTPAPFFPKEKSFFSKNILGFTLLGLFLIMFYLVYTITRS